MALGWGSSILWVLLALALIFFCLLIVLKHHVRRSETSRGRYKMKNKECKMKNPSLLNAVPEVAYDFLISFGAGSLGGTTPTIERLRYNS
jgi:uncharacterized iron-regulated membrane protein